MENGGVVGWDLHDPIDEEELDAAFSLAESLASSRKRPKSCITREDAANPIDEEELDAAFSLAESLASSRKCPKSCITREDAANPIDEEELDAAFSLPESIASSRKRPKSCITQEDACRLSHSRRLPEWGANGSVSSNRTICRRKSLPSDTAHLVSASDAQKTPVRVPREGNWALLPSPCRFNPRAKYPAMRFGGQVIYCRTFADVERAAVGLLEFIESKKRNMDQISLGLDIEWRPTFRRGEASRKAAVLQICMDNDWCYVMHIIHSGIPPTLQSILEDATSTKVGVGISNDAAKVMKDYNVRIQVVADLSGLANLKFGGVPRNWSLGALTEMLTCKELEKPKKIRLGNWEADVLSKEQIQYAATDAYASWYLFQVLKSFPDAADNPVVDENTNDVQS